MFEKLQAMSDDEFVRVELPEPVKPPVEQQPATEKEPQEEVPVARERTTSASSGSSTSSSEKEEPAQEQPCEPAAQQAEPEGTVYNLNLPVVSWVSWSRGLAGLVG